MSNFSHQFFHCLTTILQPSAISYSICARISIPYATNLICNKSTRLEVFTVETNQVVHLFDVPLYCRAETLCSLSLTSCPLDLLWITTEDCHAIILTYDLEQKEFKTLWKSNLRRPYEQLRDFTPLTRIKSNSSTSNSNVFLVGIILNQTLKIVQLNCDELNYDSDKGIYGNILSNTFEFPLELDVKTVKDFVFSEDCNSVVILYESVVSGDRILKQFDFDFTECQLLPGTLSVVCNDRSVGLLAPRFVENGVLCFGNKEINYYKGHIKRSLTIEQNENQVNLSEPTICEFIDNNQFLISDAQGHLSFVVCEKDKKTGEVIRFQHQELGRLTSVSSVTNLLTIVNENDKSKVAYLIFISSKFSDSYLVLFVPSNPHPQKLEILKTFQNIGPVSDFVLIPDPYQSGNFQIVTCTSKSPDGSVNVIQNGISLVEHASFQQNGVQGIWPLKFSLNDEYHSLLVFAFVGETRIMTLGQEVEEVVFNGIDPQTTTVYIGNVSHGYIVHVTPKSVFLLFEKTLEKVQHWSPPSTLNCEISFGSSTDSQIIVGGGRHLFYLEIQESGLKALKQASVPNDIATATFVLNSDSTPNQSSLQIKTSKTKYAHLIAVALWTSPIVLFISVPELRGIAQITLEDNTAVIRSALIHDIVLLIALGDGRVLYYEIQNDELGNIIFPTGPPKKIFSIGTTPARLSVIEFDKKPHFFVCTNKPAVLVSDDSNKNLNAIRVNLPEISHVCQFKFEYLQDFALVLANNSEIKIVSIDYIKKFNIQKIPLKEETPRRLVFHQESGLLVVLTESKSSRQLDKELCTSRLHLFDLTMSEAVYVLDLPNETLGTAIITGHFLFVDDQTTKHSECLVVSTSQSQNDASSSLHQKSFVHIYVVKSNEKGIKQQSLKLIMSNEIPGPCYALVPFHGMLLAACGTKVSLFSLNTTQGLIERCTYKGFNLVTKLSVNEEKDLILVGDLVGGVTLLSYQQEKNQLDLVAKDITCNWIQTLDFLSKCENVFICTDIKHNLYFLQSANEGENDDLMDNSSLIKIQSRYYTGENIRQMRKGNFSQTTSSNTNMSLTNSLIFATMSGAFLILNSLSENDFSFLKKLQQVMQSRTLSNQIGTHSHFNYRYLYEKFQINDEERFNNVDNIALVENITVLDGDFLALYFDLPQEKKEQIAAEMKLSPSELTLQIQQLLPNLTT